jgi:hypothetical protein
MSTGPGLDPTTRPFFEGAARGELWLQRCETCGTHQHYPRPHCLSCASFTLSFVRVAGDGVVYSRTRVHRQVREDLPAPYVVGLVELDEGPRLLALLGDEDLTIEERVRLTWKAEQDAPILVAFRRA